MTKADFQDAWVPRIGEEATAELRRYRDLGLWDGDGVRDRRGHIVCRKSSLYDLLAAVCSRRLWYIIKLINGQKRLAAALSRWFGVRIKSGQLPPMNPKRFDSWEKNVA